MRPMEPPDYAYGNKSSAYAEKTAGQRDKYGAKHHKYHLRIQTWMYQRLN